jgi:Tfp pilus assembly protein PilV
MTPPHTPVAAAPRNAAGVSLIEVLVALVMFTITLLSFASGSLIAARTMAASKSYAVGTAAAESTLDSLRSLGWTALAGLSGSYTTQGHAVTWAVTGTNPRKITVAVVRRTTPTVKSDTFVTYVAK